MELNKPPVFAAASSSVEVLNEATVYLVWLGVLEQIKYQATSRLLVACVGGI